MKKQFEYFVYEDIDDATFEAVYLFYNIALKPKTDFEQAAEKINEQFPELHTSTKGVITNGEHKGRKALLIETDLAHKDLKNYKRVSYKPGFDSQRFETLG